MQFLMSHYDRILQQVNQLELPQIIIWAAPVMFLLVMIEFIYSIKRNKNLYNKYDLAASVGIGLTNVLINSIIKGIIFVLVYTAYEFAPFKLPSSWWTIIPCLIAIDFARYWAHRVAHENRFFWATHVPHHSSEYYNLSVSFRLSWIQFVKFIFFVPVAAMGFDPFIFFIAHQIEVLYQFWIHTEVIRKLPRPIEYIFVTPSHHRVHHARNPKYIDKNYGSTLIIWDRMFNTFQPEEEQPDYGITKPVNSYNPVTLVFHELVDILKDMGKTKGLKNKIKILLGRP
ncbi:sterol desaturase family protein [Limibacter armeniacum]|uniref:sterol desaturase family protein n=1 Tax=Limibacter armeniacum TaxID=466084 RepID=UPI002FE6B7BB